MKTITKRAAIKLLPLLLLTVFVVTPSVAGNNDVSPYGRAAAKETVYICTGPKAATYHKNRNCSGLKRCSAKIKAVSLDEAKQMGRRACKRCAS